MYSGELQNANALFSKFSGFGPWTEQECWLIKSLGVRRRRGEAHQTLVYDNDPAGDIFIIQQGWSCVHKLLPNGSRQIISFPLPGDIVGFSDVMVGRATASLECISELVVASVAAPVIRSIMASNGRVGKAIYWAVEQNNAIVVEHLINAGRRSALARVAHLILEFAVRLRMIGVPTDLSFELPISQVLLADALGLTAIHVNRILRQLREAKLMTFKSGIVEIHDLEGLIKIAEFSEDYLNRQGDDFAPSSVRLRPNAV